MPDYRKSFSAKYLKALDLEDGPQTVKVTKVVEEDVFDEMKLVLYSDADKALILNKINSTTVADLAESDDTDAWVGTPIELYASTVEFQGKRVPCVRIRAPKRTRETP